MISRQRVYRFWLNVHLWVGLTLGLVVALIGLTGSALVWHDGLEAMLHPARSAVSGTEVGQPLSVYVEQAREALGPDVRISGLRLPEEAGDPVVVSGRVPAEGRPRLLSAWLDPPTGDLLDAGEAGSPFMQAMHRLHGSLMLPGIGRQLVGWTGVGLTISALTGLWLWWPLGGRLLGGLRWRRGLTASSNLHRILGAWISLPLAVVALTGVWISFPQITRSLFSPAQPERSQAGPPQGRPGFAMPLASPRMTPEEVLDAARAAAPAGWPSSINWPTESSSPWRLQWGGGPGAATVLVDDASGRARPQRSATGPQGDDLGRLMRRIHDGNDMGLVWQIVVFLTGVLPTLFGVTGLMMWLRRRRATRRRSGARLPAAG